MKQLLTLMMLALPWMGTQAQTYSLSRDLIILADDGGVEMDFTANNNPLQNVQLILTKGDDFYYVYNIGTTLQALSTMLDGTGSMLFQSSTVNPFTVSTSNYTITMNSTYNIHAYLPPSFQYKYFCHNPYTSFSIDLCAMNAEDSIMGVYHVATVPTICTQHISEGYYFYKGDGNLHTISNNLDLLLENISPTPFFEDLWYYEFDQDPMHWDGTHTQFGNTIDHFTIAINFSGS